MKEARGNLWDSGAEAIVITTNGAVKNNGEAVMGRGCALEAKNLWPEFARTLGGVIKAQGNHVHIFSVKSSLGNARYLITFPVKHHWREKADVQLIEQSVEELVLIMDIGHGKYCGSVALPRPGCGNGRLDWETEVKPLLVDSLDDRFTVYTF